MKRISGVSCTCWHVLQHYIGTYSELLGGERAAGGVLVIHLLMFRVADNCLHGFLERLNSLVKI